MVSDKKHIGPQHIGPDRIEAFKANQRFHFERFHSGNITLHDGMA